MTEGSGERATGTPNTIYDLSSVLFHALEGGASYDQYIRDAEEAGDEELATFFSQVRDEDSRRADEAQRLIAERTHGTVGSGGTSASLAGGAAAGLSSGMEQTGPALGAEEELPPTREEGSPRTEPIAAEPGMGDDPSGRVEDVPPPGLEPRGDMPGTEPIAEGAPSGDVRRETDVLRDTEDPITPGEEIPPRTTPAEGLSPERTADEAVPPPPPPRTGGSPLAEDVPSGTPPQAPPGDVQRAGEERSGQEREEDKGLIDKARDFLRGEDRERDYLGDDDRERRDRGR